MGAKKTKMKQRILQTWVGVTSGTLGGRDDGWPERKFAVYDSLEEAVAFCPGRDPEYFELSPISQRRVTSAQEKVSAQKKREERTALTRQIQRLKKRRDSLR